MSDLRAAVEGLEKFYFGKASRPVIRLDAVLALIPEGAVLVTKETLAAALQAWWAGEAAMPGSGVWEAEGGWTGDARDIIAKLRDGT